MSDLPKLKPCPFCGETRQDWLTVEGPKVHCHECGADGPLSKDQAVKWNLRADQLPAREELVEMCYTVIKAYAFRAMQDARGSIDDEAEAVADAIHALLTKGRGGI
jgi:hypothetical protein